MSRSRQRRKATTSVKVRSPIVAERQARPSPDRHRPVVDFLAKHSWTLCLVAIAAIVAVHLGAFDWYTDYPLTNADGSRTWLPNTFASVDHPFHISKERATLDAVSRGDYPRWISNHQGGYPAEFYPLGADVVVIVAWALGLGQIPLEVVHKLVVIGVLFIPIAAYWSIARRDGWPKAVVVIATLLHLFLPGSWLAGGPDELLRMGMWPNVFATYLTLPLLLFAYDWVGRGQSRFLLIAAGIATTAIYSNPRSTIAVATVFAAIGIGLVIDRYRQQQFRQRTTVRPFPNRKPERPNLDQLILRSATLVATIILLCAGLLIPLRATQNLYDFYRFVEFGGARQVWEYLIGAIPIEVLVLGIAGAVIGIRGSKAHTRIVAILFPLGLVVLVTAGWLFQDFELLRQLEGPRLIPMIRLPLIFLAAIGMYKGAHYLLRDITGPNRLEKIDGIAVIAVAVAVLSPISPFADGERGLPTIETTNQPRFPEIARSAIQIQNLATSNDRVMIVGSPISEHASFWIPALTDVNAFHSKWVWYWRTPDYADQTQVTDISSALDLEFLRTNALTLVVVANNYLDELVVAYKKPHLEPVPTLDDTGYTIFRVEDAGPSTRGQVAVDGGEVTSVQLSRERLRAEVFTLVPATARIAINDYPAWSATVNGVETPIRRSPDGYMLVDVPGGYSAVVLTYNVTSVVWISRGFVIVGIVVLVAATIVPMTRRRRHRES